MTIPLPFTKFAYGCGRATIATAPPSPESIRAAAASPSVAAPPPTNTTVCAKSLASPRSATATAAPAPALRRWIPRRRGDSNAPIVDRPTQDFELPDLAPTADALARSLALHPVVARILALRGIESPEQAAAFLRPKLSDLADPFLLQDMQPAAERILRAIREQEKICVFGDYDVDGVTSTAILAITLRALGADFTTYIPDRMREGYGLSREGIEAVARRGTKLLVTVDNGISALDEIAYARTLGLDVVVTDHHTCGPQLPDAHAVVNPNRPDAWYPHGRLSGAGVAFKVAHALLKLSGMPAEEGRAILGLLLEFSGLGTLADMVPLHGENRILARWGLDRIARSERPGLRALLEQAGRNGKAITSFIVNFVIAPRINAAGRTAHADQALQLLLTEDPAKASDLARELDRLNGERRAIEDGILSGSLELLRSRGDLDNNAVLVADGEGWHHGVLGIVAARILERYSRPVIVLAVEEGFAKGSARSVIGYNIHEALTACAKHLVSYGGHAAAAGLRLRASDVAHFRAAINEHARETLGAASSGVKILEIDTLVQPEEIDLPLAKALQTLEPFGTDNPEPVLALRGARLAMPPKIMAEKHLRLKLRAREFTFDAVGFNLAQLAPVCEGAAEGLDLAFTPRITEYWGPPSVELELRDVRPSRVA